MKKPVISILSALTGAVLGAGALGKAVSAKLHTEQEKSHRYRELFNMMNRWVNVKQEGKNLSSYFQEHGYKKIAVYGMGVAGETLLDELQYTGISVAYGIDRRADSLSSSVDIFTVDDSLDEVDAVVVTAITFFDEIEEQLSEKMDCPIISLEDVLYDNIMKK